MGNDGRTGSGGCLQQTRARDVQSDDKRRKVDLGGQPHDELAIDTVENPTCVVPGDARANSNAQRRHAQGAADTEKRDIGEE